MTAEQTLYPVDIENSADAFAHLELFRDIDLSRLHRLLEQCREVEVAQYNRLSPLKVGEHASTFARFAEDCATAARLHADHHHEQVLLSPAEFAPLASLHAALTPYTRQEGVAPAKTLLRASRVPWEYGNHYDCPDGYLLQLHNRRRVALTCQEVAPYRIFGLPPRQLAATWEVTLSPGDLLFIPSQLSHAVDTEAEMLDASRMSIAASFSWQHNDAQCDATFQRDFPQRTAHLQKGAK